MGGGDRPKQAGNVIIPEMGAGAYWYVDPRALGIPGSQSQPAAPQQQQGLDQSVISDAMKRMFESSLVNRPGTSSQVYDPMEQVRLNQQQDKEFEQQFHRMGPEDVNKTVTMNIGKEQWEVPAVFDNMTDYERNVIQYLPHTQWPKSILNKIENNARDNLEQGNDPFGNPIRQPKYGF